LFQRTGSVRRRKRRQIRQTRPKRPSSQEPVFFGLDKSKRAILDAGFAIVCEPARFDCVFHGGVQNIVAPQGTASRRPRAHHQTYVDEVCCVLIRTKPARMPPCGRSTICWRPAWPCGCGGASAARPDSFIKANGGDAFGQLVESAEGFLITI